MIAARKAVLVQHLVEKNAGMISRKWSTAAVGAMHSGCKPDDHEARVGCTKRRHGPAVVLGIAIFNIIKEGREPWTGAAIPVEDGILEHALQSSMWRMIASPKPRVPMSFAPGTI